MSVFSFTVHQRCFTPWMPCPAACCLLQYLLICCVSCAAGGGACTTHSHMLPYQCGVPYPTLPPVLCTPCGCVSRPAEARHRGQRTGPHLCALRCTDCVRRPAETRHRAQRTGLRLCALHCTGSHCVQPGGPCAASTGWSSPRPRACCDHRPCELPPLAQRVGLRIGALRGTGRPLACWLPPARRMKCSRVGCTMAFRSHRAVLALVRTNSIGIAAAELGA